MGIKSFFDKNGKCLFWSTNIYMLTIDLPSYIANQVVAVRWDFREGRFAWQSLER